MTRRQNRRFPYAFALHQLSKEQSAAYRKLLLAALLSIGVMAQRAAMLASVATLRLIGGQPLYDHMDPCPVLPRVDRDIVPPTLLGRGVRFPGSASAEKYILTHRSFSTSIESTRFAYIHGRCIHTVSQLDERVWEMRGERFGDTYNWCVKLNYTVPRLLQFSDILENTNGCSQLDTPFNLDWALDRDVMASCPVPNAFRTIGPVLAGYQVGTSASSAPGAGGRLHIESMHLHENGRTMCRTDGCYTLCGNRHFPRTVPDRTTGEPVQVLELSYGDADGDTACELARVGTAQLGDVTAQVMQVTLNLAPLNATCPATVPPLLTDGYDGDPAVESSGSAAYDYPHWHSRESAVSQTPLPTEAQTQSQTAGPAGASPSSSAQAATTPSQSPSGVSVPSPSSTASSTAFATPTGSPTASPSAGETPSATPTAAPSSVGVTGSGSATPTPSVTASRSSTGGDLRAPQGGRVDSASINATGAAVLGSVCALTVAGIVAVRVLRRRGAGAGGSSDGDGKAPGGYGFTTPASAASGGGVVGGRPLTAPMAARSWRAGAAVTAPGPVGYGGHGGDAVVYGDTHGLFDSGGEGAFVLPAASPGFRSTGGSARSVQLQNPLAQGGGGVAGSRPLSSRGERASFAPVSHAYGPGGEGYSRHPSARV